MQPHTLQLLHSLACIKHRLCGHVQVGIGLVMMPPVIAAFTWILQHTGPMVPLYLWSFIFGLQIFFMTIYPIAIAPLFNKFSPLEKGTLKCARTREPGAVILLVHIGPASYCSTLSCMQGMYCRPATTAGHQAGVFSLGRESRTIAGVKSLQGC